MPPELEQVAELLGDPQSEAADVGHGATTGVEDDMAPECEAMKLLDIITVLRVGPEEFISVVDQVVDMETLGLSGLIGPIGPAGMEKVDIGKTVLEEPGIVVDGVLDIKLIGMVPGQEPPATLDIAETPDPISPAVDESDQQIPKSG